MKIGAGLEASPQQLLKMAPQLIQSVKLLHFGYEELQDWVHQQVECNPLLELSSPIVTEFGNRSLDKPQLSRHGASSSLPAAGVRNHDDIASIENYCSRPVTLHEHLRQQAMTTLRNKQDQLVACEIIESIEPDGYLRRDLLEIIQNTKTTEAKAEQLLRLIQEFDPVGVGARDLAECLRIQLRVAGQLTPPMEILLANLPLLANRNLNSISRLCGVDINTVQELSKIIRKLEPKPGRFFESEPTMLALPDVYIHIKADNSLHIELNTSLLPRVLINNVYYSEIKCSSLGDEEKYFINNCVKSANWILRSLDQRAQTILKVSTEVASRQRDFFIKGSEYLSPLTMRDVSDAIGLHESTVSRAVANKYMMTNRGMFEIKYFFSAAISGLACGDDFSAHTVRAKIKQLIAAETFDNILSDDAIAEQLQGDGINIARRTIAKYREIMRIPASTQRRQYKKSELFVI